MVKQELSDYIVKSVEGANRIASGQIEILLKNANEFPQKLKSAKYKIKKRTGFQGWLWHGFVAGYFTKAGNAIRGKYFKKSTLDLEARLFNPTYGVNKAQSYLTEFKKFYEKDNDKKGLLEDIKKHLVSIYNIDFNVAFSKEIMERREGIRLGICGLAGSSLIFSLGQALPKSEDMLGKSYIISCFWVLVGLLGAPALVLLKNSYDAHKILKKAKTIFQKREKERKAIESMEISELEDLLMENKKKILAKL